MKTVTKTALANLKLNRGRNLISGFAILLTTLLIFFTITIGMAAESVELVPGRDGGECTEAGKPE